MVSGALRMLLKHRANNRCEFCGRPKRSIMDVHHRWYPSHDTLSNLMLIHRGCHEAIHYRRSMQSIGSAPGSLASKGDAGFNNTPDWEDYLNRR